MNTYGVLADAQYANWPFLVICLLVYIFLHWAMQRRVRKDAERKHQEHLVLQRLKLRHKAQ